MNPSDKKLANHTSVQCTDLVHCVSESEIGFWKAKSPCANGERGTLGVTRLAGRTGQGWPSSGWAGQARRGDRRGARVCHLCTCVFIPWWVFRQQARDCLCRPSLFSSSIHCFVTSLGAVHRNHQSYQEQEGERTRLNLVQ